MLSEQNWNGNMIDVSEDVRYNLQIFFYNFVL